MNDAKAGIFPRKITREQARDTGMAMVLICLLLSMLFESDLYVGIATIVLVANMIVPMLFKYPAFVWLGFSHLVGAVVSKILLTLIFFLIVTPISLFRRILGFDSLKLRRFKKDTGSVMISRGISYSSKDLEVPY